LTLPVETLKSVPPGKAVWNANGGFVSVLLTHLFCFFVEFSRDQWRFMTSLTGGEIRDNCVDEIFLPHPYKCGVLPHLATFATSPPPYLFLQPLKLAT